MSDCIFCRIVAGEIPCYKLYEDDLVLAFLDVGPVSEGHCLVIPKVHIERLDEAEAEHAAALAAVMSVLPRLGKAMAEATAAAGWNVLQNNGEVSGQAVPHVHFHIIPRREGDGLGYRWDAGQLDKGKAGALVEAVTQGMG